MNKHTRYVAGRIFQIMGFVLVSSTAVVTFIPGLYDAVAAAATAHPGSVPVAVLLVSAVMFIVGVVIEPSEWELPNHRRYRQAQEDGTRIYECLGNVMTDDEIETVEAYLHDILRLFEEETKDNVD